MCAAEQKRGCGFRKTGGLYLRSNGPAFPCPKLPFELGECPTCHAGIRATRSIQFIEASILMAKCGPCPTTGPAHGSAPHDGKPLCRLRHPEHLGEVGLMLASNKFYTPESFAIEARELGVSKRISAIPRKLELGKTYIFLAYNYVEATETSVGAEPENVETKTVQRAFYAFIPQKIELIVSPTWKAENAEQVAHHEKRGVHLVEVPDGDPDHMPTHTRKPWEVVPKPPKEHHAIKPTLAAAIPFDGARG